MKKNCKIGITQTEDIKQMRARHKEEIEALESSCKHEKISGWMPYMQAPGHLSGSVKACENSIGKCWTLKLVSYMFE